MLKLNIMPELNIMLKLNIMPELNIMLKLNIMPDLNIYPNKEQRIIAKMGSAWNHKYKF